MLITKLAAEVNKIPQPKSIFCCKNNTQTTRKYSFPTLSPKVRLYTT
jgi:hypothetical protein